MAYPEQNNAQNHSVSTHASTQRAIELIQRITQQAAYNNVNSTPEFLEQLDLLKQTFSCNLFKSVREVYDQIYESNIINSSPELKSSATAKATVAVFSSSIAHTQPRIVELPKNGQGLGFNVMSFEGSPVFISHITPGSVADQSKSLRKGDQLVSIDGVNVEHADHKACVELLKDAKNKVSLVVKYMPGLLNEIESSYIVRHQLNEHNQ